MVLMWMDGILLVLVTIFACCLGWYILSELVKYLRVERYLAAKIGTISLVLLWWVVFITYG
jgi:hypothetical protein